jgi:hypothetical protein
MKHDRLCCAREDFAIDPLIVGGGVRGSRKMAARHEHDARPKALHVLELLPVRRDHGVE